MILDTNVEGGPQLSQGPAVELPLVCLIPGTNIPSTSLLMIVYL